MTEDTSKTAPVRGAPLWGRRFLAATVVVPPDVAKLLNTEAMAVLAVIRDEARATGKCTLPVARIAERANIGRAKTRAAIRLAEYLGLIAIEQEPGQERAIINRRVTSRSPQTRTWEPQTGVEATVIAGEPNPEGISAKRLRSNSRSDIRQRGDDPHLGDIR